MAKNNFEADKLLVEGFDWTYLIPTEELPVKVESNTKSYSYTKDLASYLESKSPLLSITKAVRMVLLDNLNFPLTIYA